MNQCYQFGIVVRMYFFFVPTRALYHYHRTTRFRFSGAGIGGCRCINRKNVIEKMFELICTHSKYYL